jgi:hypothetical protein
MKVPTKRLISDKAIKSATDNELWRCMQRIPDCPDIQAIKKEFFSRKIKLYPVMDRG